MNVQTYKTILSVGLAGDVFKFVDMDTKLVEMETGMTQNESVTWAVRSAIEAAVLALIKQGDQRGYWTINWPDGIDQFEILDADISQGREPEVEEESLINKILVPNDDS